MKKHPIYPDDQRLPVMNWTPRPACRVRSMDGRSVRIEPFDGARHAMALWEVFDQEAMNERVRWFGWPWIENAEGLAGLLEGLNTHDGWSTAAIVIRDKPVGMASFMREDRTNGVIEIGAVAHSDQLARTPASTEAHQLLMKHSFDLGYRRYEWKSDAANEASKRAAERLGFTYEGTFRNHAVNHGRSRDTAWYSITIGEWPRVKKALEMWADPSNFEANGRQIQSLIDIRNDLHQK